MKLGLIVATDQNGVIGINGTLPWRKPADLNRFRRITEGSVLLMGRTTWESINRPLKGRHILVLTHRPLADLAPGVEAVGSLAGALARAEALGVSHAWVAGGETLYRQALSLLALQTVDLTVIAEAVPLPLDESIPVARFPGVAHDFLLVEEAVNNEDPTLTHKVYVRKKPSITMQAVRPLTTETP